MHPALPFAPGAAREYLRSQEDFIALVGADPSLVTTRELPDPLERPVVTIQAGLNHRENILAHKVRLMISVWVPPIEILVDGDPPTPKDPEELAWDIASLSGQLLDMRRYMGQGPSFQYRGATWRGTWDDGPVTLVDTDRGPNHPIYRAVIQVVMTLGSN
nr:hypothetical protein ISGA_3998 [Gordonia sp. NB41Y]